MSNYIIAEQDTILKKSTKQSSELTADQRHEVFAGKRYQVTTYGQEEVNHLKVSLGHGAGDWFIYIPHWNISWLDNKEQVKEPYNEDAREGYINLPYGGRDVDWNNPEAAVSKYFKVKEVTLGDSRRIPEDPAIMENILQLAQELDKIREAWGSPLLINSWYRPPLVNRSIGGASNSQHLYGLAADIRPANGRGVEFENWLDSVAWSNRALGYGQRANKNFTHLDLRQERIRWNY